MSETDVCVLRQSFLVEVTRVRGRWQLCRHGNELVEDPGGLSKVIARVFDAITVQVHVASASAEAHSEVVE